MEKNAINIHWFLSYNTQCFKNYVFLIRLADPRIWIKIKLDDTYNDLDFIQPLYVENLQWLDGRPDINTQKIILDEGMKFLNIELEYSNKKLFEDMKFENLIEEF